MKNTYKHNLLNTLDKWGIKPHLSLDIGANVGQSALVLSPVSYRVWSFEPHPKVFPKLVKRVKGLPNVRTFNYGVSDQTATLKMTDREQHACNMICSNGTVDIRVKPVRHISADFVKCDVEGYELTALQGLDLSLTKWVFVELRERTKSELDDYLTGLGFINVDTLPNNGGTSDALYIRR